MTWLSAKTYRPGMEHIKQRRSQALELLLRTITQAGDSFDRTIIRHALHKPDLYGGVVRRNLSLIYL